jgi:molybdate transport system substrate-binding protein
MRPTRRPIRASKSRAPFPEDSHPPIVYPVALTADSKNPDAARLLAFLTSAAARPIFEKQGFTVLR